MITRDRLQNYLEYTDKAYSNATRTLTNLSLSKDQIRASKERCAAMREMLDSQGRCASTRSESS